MTCVPHITENRLLSRLGCTCCLSSDIQTANGIRYNPYGGYIADSDLDFLSRLPLFQELSLDEISILDQYLGLMELEKGDTVFDEGENGEFVCFVTNGELEVLKKSSNGDSSSITKLGTGQTIGEMALVDELPRSATVKAHSPSSLTVLSRKGFEELAAESPEIAIKILKYLARSLSLNLRRTSNRLSDSLDADQSASG